MTTHDPTGSHVPGARANRLTAVRRATETKASYKTTELAVYVIVSVAVLIASAVVDADEDGQWFTAHQAWTLVTWLTIGYMISRGLAKSGSREYYDREPDRGADDLGGGVYGDRLRGPTSQTPD